MAGDQFKIDLKSFDPEKETFGPMHSETDDTPIPYLPFQMSKYSLGIVAHDGLDVGSEIVVNAPIGSIPLRVIGIDRQGVPPGGARYNLMSTLPDMDFETAYESVGTSNQRLCGVRQTRFQTLPPVVVVSKTFGSTSIYDFVSVNASKSGILMMATKGNVPFREGTLVEVEIQRNQHWLDRDLSLHARVVHHTLVEGKIKHKTHYVGLELKDFVQNGEHIWRKALEKLEKANIKRAMEIVENKSA